MGAQYIERLTDDSQFVEAIQVRPERDNMPSSLVSKCTCSTVPFISRPAGPIEFQSDQCIIDLYKIIYLYKI